MSGVACVVGAANSRVFEQGFVASHFRDSSVLAADSDNADADVFSSVDVPFVLQCARDIPLYIQLNRLESKEHFLSIIPSTMNTTIVCIEQVCSRGQPHPVCSISIEILTPTVYNSTLVIPPTCALCWWCPTVTCRCVIVFLCRLLTVADS